MFDALRHWFMPLDHIDEVKDQELRRRELEAERKAQQALEELKAARLSYDPRDQSEVDRLRAAIDDTDTEIREALNG